MVEIVYGSTRQLADVERFIGTLNTLDQHPTPEARALFDDQAELFVARAPGRLDVMGGIADYSGSLVLQWPIQEATRVAIRPWPESRISITSVGPHRDERRCDVPLELVADANHPYGDVRAWFGADPARQWAAYVAGVFHVL